MITYDPSDFIIEKCVEHQPSWGNSRIVYRIRRWDQQSRRYCFEGDHFWIGNLYSKLKNEFGIEHPETLPIVSVER